MQKQPADSQTTGDQLAEYRGADADALAARIDAALGTEAETLADVVWLLRYTTVKHNIKLPTMDELLEMRRDVE